MFSCPIPLPPKNSEEIDFEHFISLPLRTAGYCLDNPFASASDQGPTTWDPSKSRLRLSVCDFSYLLPHEAVGLLSAVTAKTLVSSTLATQTAG